MAYDSNLTQSSNGLFGWAPALLSELRSRYQRKRVYRQTLRELSALSARELDDLGLNRSMLKRVAWQASQGV